MRRSVIVRAAALLAAWVAGFPVQAAEPAPDDLGLHLVLGTATEGGGFQLFGRHLAEALQATDPELRVEAIATRGSRHNLALLEEGRVDLGLVEGNAARRALEGIGRPRADLRVLAVMYPNPGMFVVRSDSNYRTIEDLTGQPVAFGTRASGLRILAGDVLSGLGLSPGRDFTDIVLDRAADGPRRVLDGSAAALWGAGIGWPGFVEVADSAAGGRFISPSAEQIERVLARHPHLRRMAVPAGTYRGQDRRIDSVGLWSLILVRPGVPESTVHRLAAALHRGEPALAERLAQGRYSTAANTVEQVAAGQLHPGAARYFREVGLLR